MNKILSLLLTFESNKNCPIKPEYQSVNNLPENTKNAPHDFLDRNSS